MAKASPTQHYGKVSINSPYSEHSDIRAMHLHPKDVGAAIVSIDESTPPTSWRWAGPQWRYDAAARGDIVDATIATRDPVALAQRWANVLGLAMPTPSEGALRLAIDSGSLTFAPLREGNERIVEFGVRGINADLPVMLGGTCFRHSR